MRKRVVAVRSCGVLAALIVVSTATPAMSRAEYALGGEEGIPWEAALSKEPGSYRVFSGNEEVASVPVAVPERGMGTDTLMEYTGGRMQPVRIDPSWNLARRLDLAGGRITSSEAALHLDGNLKTIVLAFDGDPATAVYRDFTQDPNAPPGVGSGWRENIIVDFGADLPINRVRFYPRLGEDDEQIIARMEEPRPPSDAFPEESFSQNHLEWFALSVADHTAPFSQETFQPPGKRWFYNYRERGTADDPELKKILVTRENLDVVVDFRFPLRHERYVAVRPFNPVRGWEIAEFEVYGDGHVEKAVYLTHILDFGRPVNWSKIRWAGELPGGTRVEIRTRTGSDPEPLDYWRTSSVTGELERTDVVTWERIRADRRPEPTYDVDHWSFWSPPYEFAAGVRDEDTPAGEWRDGTPIASPSPRRYIQLWITAYSTRTKAPRLDQLWLLFSETPAATELVGEIWPAQVSSTESASFTYVVRPRLSAGDRGFDRLEILTRNRVDTVRSVRVHGRDVDLEVYRPEILSDRMVVAFPRLKGEVDDLKQVEVRFDVSVLHFGTEFLGWVFDSDDPDRLRQRVAPGNATYQYGSDGLSVRTELRGSLLKSLAVSANPFTPNGDGINDEVRISFQVRQVQALRPMKVEVFDLLGRQVCVLADGRERSGTFEIFWKGLDETGRRVTPGIYLYRIELQTDSGPVHRVGILCVAY